MGKETRTKDARLEKYFAYEQVTGCTTPPQAVLMAFFLDAVLRRGIAGDLLEIGVYRGRSSMLFGMFLEAHRKLHLVDPGISGDVLEDLTKNVTALAEGLDFDKRVIVDCRMSHDLRKDVAQTNRGQYGFIHIDGGHGVADVYRDLETAKHMLNDQGIVICDDFYGAARPDVTEAVYKYLHHHPNDFKILLTGYNKAILTRVDSYEMWWIEIVENLVDYLETNWRLVQLHLYSSPLEFPTLGLSERAPSQPQYGGRFEKEESKDLVRALTKAIG